MTHLRQLPTLTLAAAKAIAAAAEAFAHRLVKMLRMATSFSVNG